MPFRTILGLVLVALLARPVHAAEVVVFAAASLKTALDAVAADFKARTGHDVVISYAGSGQLARQIIAGAPADIFLAADPVWMQAVEAEGLVVAETRRELLGNSLVLVAHGVEALPVRLGPEFVALLGTDRLAMGLVDSVPAGQYGKAALQHLGLWDSISDRVAQTDNVRAALALVARGEAALGIVYASDAGASDRVSIVAHFPPDSHPPILYPAALTTNARDAADRAFLEALSSPEASATFAAHGFLVLN